jgi:hypothetical protein
MKVVVDYFKYYPGSFGGGTEESHENLSETIR